MNDASSPARCPSGVPARLAEREVHGPSLSFELYPPRSAAANEALWLAIARLTTAEPDFFSVTYGASGSSRETSRDVVRWILAHTDVPVVAHLTCIDSHRDQVREVAEALVADGVRDFLALRGDPPADATDWRPHPDGLSRASYLVELLRELEADHTASAGRPAHDRSFSVAVAASPAALRAVAPGADSLAAAARACGDVRALLAKQEAGADYAITQVFFDVEDYVRYVDAVRAAGVTLPLLPGIVPLNDPRRLRRLQEISGVDVPSRILDRLDLEDDDDSRRAAGTAMGVELVEQVLAAGAPGLHIYTFNQHAAALDLLEGAHLGGRAAPRRTAGDLAGRPRVGADLTHSTPPGG
jgi:methylenetetrahydrofolate reductase (NADPH)